MSLQNKNQVDIEWFAGAVEIPLIDQTTAQTNFTLNIMFSGEHLESIFAMKCHQIECRESIDSVCSDRFFKS